MDPLDFLSPDELLRFFHCKKTVLSCMPKPLTFLSQLRDHDLIPEDRFKKLSRMKSQESLKRGVYELLDWLETERPQHIHDFWTCVFQDVIINQYPTLRLLRNSLMDGSFQFRTKLPEKLDNEETNENKRKELSDEEGERETHLSSGKTTKKSKARDEEASAEDADGDEQPGTSSQLIPSPRKRPKKISFSSPLKKGHKGDIWNWTIFKTKLLVTCGDLEGSLDRKRLAEGEKCIMRQKQWFTPTEFERRAGKQSSGNWKQSIECNGVPLERLIQEGHLTSGEYDQGGVQAKKSLFPCDQVISVADEDEAQASSLNKGSSPDGSEEEETEQVPSRKVLCVTCEGATGTLHTRRFASGTCGKSIRTETRWMSPVEFVQEATGQTDLDWRTDIQCGGKPLGVLMDENIHELQCGCRLCRPDQQELENQRNDDECFVCRSDVGPDLVECDDCPRSFHQRCHLPHVDDEILRDKRRWICTFCVLETMQQCRYSDELEVEAATSHQISQHMLECQYLLLRLCSADEDQMFATNPSVYLKNYPKVIQTPMWFEKVADKLQKGKYQTVGGFVSDVQLIFTNCSKYNQRNADILELGRKLKRLFDEEFKKVFGISESTAD